MKNYTITVNGNVYEHVNGTIILPDYPTVDNVDLTGYATEEFVNNKVSELVNSAPEALDTITSCAAVFKNMIDYSTINYKQQQDLLQTARKRVNTLLGGAHSPEYKEYSRIYFKNLWQDFCKAFDCGSYKDLNPLYMADDVAKKWIQNWEYTEA